MSRIRTVSDSFTRPADTNAYTAGDLVANSTTAGSVVPLSFGVGTGSFKIVEVHIRKSGTGVTAADFDLHLYSASPTCANGDNGAWSTNGVADYIGYIEGGQMVAFTDGASVRNALAYGAILSHKAGGTIYGLLEVQGTYTPASAEVFTVDLEIETDTLR